MNDKQRYLAGESFPDEGIDQRQIDQVHALDAAGKKIQGGMDVRKIGSKVHYHVRVVNENSVILCPNENKGATITVPKSVFSQKYRQVDRQGDRERLLSILENL